MKVLDVLDSEEEECEEEMDGDDDDDGEGGREEKRTKGRLQKRMKLMRVARTSGRAVQRTDALTAGWPVGYGLRCRGFGVTLRSEAIVKV